MGIHINVHTLSASVY